MDARGRRFGTRMITGTALLLALGVVLPFAFHMVPLGGRIFLPMHIPTFIAGLLLGPVSGLIVGAGSPVVSALLTGRPTVPYMIPMLFELATYGIVAGVLRTRLRAVFTRRSREIAAPRRGRVPIRAPRTTGSFWTPCLLLSLIGAMIAGRIVWLAVVVWLAPVVGITARSVAMALAAIGAGWIGMAIQIALIPPIVRAIERSGNP